MFMENFDSFLNNKGKNNADNNVVAMLDGIRNEDYYDPSNIYNILYFNCKQFSKANKIFRKACEDNKVNMFIIDSDDKVCTENGRYYVKTDDGKNIEINEGNTVAFFRNYSSTKVVNTKKMIRNNSPILCSNPVSASRNTFNKYKTFNILDSKNVSTIPSLFIDGEIFEKNGLDNASKLKEYITSKGYEFPVVLKVLTSSKGVGIFKCPDNSVLSSVLQYTIEKEEEGVIIQPCLDIDSDLRVHVLCSNFNPKTATDDDYVVIGSMRRHKANDDFRTNFSVGGEVEYADLTEDEKKLAIDALKAVGGVWMGIDICHDKGTDKDYVIEINSTPGLTGICSTVASDENPVYRIIASIPQALDKSKSR